MLDPTARAIKFPKHAPSRSAVARFGFSIRTRGGVLMENLFIPGASIDEAERKLRQIYLGCSVVARFVPDFGLSSDGKRRKA